MPKIGKMVMTLLLTLGVYSLLEGAAQLKSLTVLAQVKTAVLIDSQKRKTGFEKDPEQFYRQIPNSDWRATPPLSEDYPEGSSIELKNPSPGLYQLLFRSTASSPSWFGASVIAVVDGKSHFYSVNGRGFRNENHVFDIQLVDSATPLTITVPYIKMAQKKHQSGFYYEVKDSHLGGFIIQDPLGHRFGNDASLLEDYEELSYAAMGGISYANMRKQFQWGWALCPSPGSYGIMVSMNRNNDPKSVTERFPFTISIQSWDNKGVLQPVQVVSETIGWGERKTIPIEIK